MSDLSCEVRCVDCGHQQIAKGFSRGKDKYWMSSARFCDKCDGVVERVINLRDMTEEDFDEAQAIPTKEAAPVAYFAKREYGGVELWEQVSMDHIHMPDVVPLYTHPPAAAAPESQPVAWMLPHNKRFQILGQWFREQATHPVIGEGWIPLYTHPPAERVAMLEGLLREVVTQYDDEGGNAVTLADTIERIRAALEG